MSNDIAMGQSAASVGWLQCWWKKLSGQTILFYALIFCTVAFSRDFAYLHLRLMAEAPFVGLGSKSSSSTSFFAQVEQGGLSIYATEIFLALVLGGILIRRLRENNWGFERTPLDYWYALWFLVGLAELVRGIVGGNNILLAFRDFGMIYYVVFYYVAREVCSTWQRIHWLFLVISVGTALRILIANWYYVVDENFLPGGEIHWPDYSRFMSGINGAYILVAVITGMSLWQWAPLKRRWILFLYISLAAFTLVLTQQRSLMIALLIGVGVVTVGGKLLGTLKPVNPAWLLAGVVLVGALMWMVRVSVGPPGHAAFLGPINYFVLKTVCTADFTEPAVCQHYKVEATESKDTASFRKDAWEEAWRRFMKNPFLGEGLGKPFIFYDSVQKRSWTEDVRPHNTYMTVLYKMGLVGLAVFIVIHVVFYLAVWQRLRRELPSMKTYLWGLTAATIGLQVYGFLNLLLESPFLSLFYWSLVGLIITPVKFPEVEDLRA